MTKAARAKFESRRTSRLSRSTEALPSCAAEEGINDIQSRRSSVQLRLFSSARQPSRSAQPSNVSEEVSGGRSRRSRRRPRSHHQPAVTDEQSASSAAASVTADSQSTSSTQSSSSTRRQPLTDLQSRAVVSPSAADERRDTVSSETRDQSVSTLATHLSAVAVTRRFRAPSVTVPMPFSSVTGRNVQVSDDRKTASRHPDDYCNAYVFTQQPLLPGEELVVQIACINVDYRGGLTFGLTACDPTRLNSADLPDDADKLLDRPEYWVVRKNICSHPKVNDELAFLRTVSGKFLFTTAEVKIPSLEWLAKYVVVWFISADVSIHFKLYFSQGHVM